MKRYVLILGLMLTLPRLSFAGYAAVVAPEYYAQGLNCEKKGMLFEAKVFYQKALLLDPGIKEKEDINRRIAGINSALSGTEISRDQLKQGAGKEPAAKYSPSKNTYKALDNPVILPRREDRSQQVIAKKADSENMRKDRPVKFLTYYNGSEPFLRRCYSALCRKTIYNNFGISYAQDGVYPKARGMFKECLRIDPYFKPASFNLNLLDDLEKQ